MAASLLDLAKLMAKNPPAGWRRAAMIDWATGFNAAVWKSADETVVAIDGLSTVVDVVGSVIRRIFGYDPRILRFVQRQNPDVVIGHSGGGGIASWVGARLNLRTICFASGRTKWSLENDGSKQTVIYIRGDRWGDPAAGYGMPLPGRTIVMNRVQGFDDHKMTGVVAAMEAEGVA